MEHDPDGATAEVLGLALRELRGQAGLSLRELGRRALYGYTRLSRAERGDILIPAPQVQVLDDVLHAGGLLVSLRRGIPAAPAAVTARRCNVTGSEPVTLEIRLPRGGSLTVSLSRRQFTQILATGHCRPPSRRAAARTTPPARPAPWSSPPGSTPRSSATSAAPWPSSTAPTRCSAPAGSSSPS
jgi:transcriptional regulator with XRE-family HTH domain